MALTNRIGNALRKISLLPKLPRLQAVRCMSSSKIFVGGLSYTTDDNTMKKAFSIYGNVLEAKVVTDRDSSLSKGFGYITYTSNEEAATAITAMDGKDLQGRVVRVTYASDHAGGILRVNGFSNGGSEIVSFDSDGYGSVKNQSGSGENGGGHSNVQNVNGGVVGSGECVNMNINAAAGRYDSSGSYNTTGNYDGNASISRCNSPNTHGGSNGAFGGSSGSFGGSHNGNGYTGAYANFQDGSSGGGHGGNGGYTGGAGGGGYVSMNCNTDYGRYGSDRSYSTVSNHNSSVYDITCSRHCSVTSGSNGSDFGRSVTDGSHNGNCDTGPFATAQFGGGNGAFGGSSAGFNKHFGDVGGPGGGGYDSPNNYGGSSGAIGGGIGGLGSGHFSVASGNTGSNFARSVTDVNWYGNCDTGQYASAQDVNGGGGHGGYNGEAGGNEYFSMNRNVVARSYGSGASYNDVGKNGGNAFNIYGGGTGAFGGSSGSFSSGHFSVASGNNGGNFAGIAIDRRYGNHNIGGYVSPSHGSSGGEYVGSGGGYSISVQHGGGCGLGGRNEAFGRGAGGSIGGHFGVAGGGNGSNFAGIVTAGSRHGNQDIDGYVSPHYECSNGGYGGSGGRYGSSAQYGTGSGGVHGGNGVYSGEATGSDYFNMNSYAAAGGYGNDRCYNTTGNYNGSVFGYSATDRFGLPNTYGGGNGGFSGFSDRQLPFSVAGGSNGSKFTGNVTDVNRNSNEYFSMNNNAAASRYGSYRSHDTACNHDGHAAGYGVASRYAPPNTYGGGIGAFGGSCGSFSNGHIDVARGNKDGNFTGGNRNGNPNTLGYGISQYGSSDVSSGGQYFSAQHGSDGRYGGNGGYSGEASRGVYFNMHNNAAASGYGSGRSYNTAGNHYGSANGYNVVGRFDSPNANDGVNGAFGGSSDSFSGGHFGGDVRGSNGGMLAGNGSYNGNHDNNSGRRYNTDRNQDVSASSYGIVGRYDSPNTNGVGNGAFGGSSGSFNIRHVGGVDDINGGMLAGNGSYNGNNDTNSGRNYNINHNQVHDTNGNVIGGSSNGSRDTRTGRSYNTTSNQDGNASGHGVVGRYDSLNTISGDNGTSDGSSGGFSGGHSGGFGGSNGNMHAANVIGSRSVGNHDTSSGRNYDTTRNQDVSAVGYGVADRYDIPNSNGDGNGAFGGRSDSLSGGHSGVAAANVTGSSSNGNLDISSGRNYNTTRNQNGNADDHGVAGRYDSRNTSGGSNGAIGGSSGRGGHSGVGSSNGAKFTKDLIDGFRKAQHANRGKFRDGNNNAKSHNDISEAISDSIIDSMDIEGDLLKFDGLEDPLSSEPDFIAYLEDGWEPQVAV